MDDVSPAALQGRVLAKGKAKGFTHHNYRQKLRAAKATQRSSEADSGRRRSSLVERSRKVSPRSMLTAKLAANKLSRLGTVGSLRRSDRRSDRNSDVRSSAAQALGNLGEHAKDAVPALIEYLKGSNWRVRNSAAQALRKSAASLAYSTRSQERACRSGLLASAARSLG